MWTHLVRSRAGLFSLAMIFLATACGGATRATVHEDDMKKVFPWPTRRESVDIKVRPQTTMANMCVWFGSWEEVKVGRDVTFYIEDETGKKFAYTPSRSPMMRLAPLDSMEIRWPLAGQEPAEKAPAEDGDGKGDKTESGKSGGKETKVEKNKKANPPPKKPETEAK